MNFDLSPKVQPDDYRYPKLESPVFDRCRYNITSSCCLHPSPCYGSRLGSLASSPACSVALFPSLPSNTTSITSSTGSSSDPTAFDPKTVRTACWVEAKRNQTDLFQLTLKTGEALYPYTSRQLNKHWPGMSSFLKRTKKKWTSSECEAGTIAALLQKRETSTGNEMVVDYQVVYASPLLPSSPFAWVNAGLLGNDLAHSTIFRLHGKKRGKSVYYSSNKKKFLLKK